MARSPLWLRSLLPLAVAPVLARADVLWLKQLGTSDKEDGGIIAPDGTGGVYIAGFTHGNFAGPAYGETDIAVARLDSSGKVLWKQQLGTSESDGANAVAPDGVGGLFVAAWTEGDLGGPNGGKYDAVLARYRPDGGLVWVVQFGTPEADLPLLQLLPDGVGGVFVAGWTEGSLGGPQLGWRDAFVGRFDADGHQSWMTQFGTPVRDEAHGLAPDGAGGVLVSGVTEGDLGAPSLGKSDAFIARFDSLGTAIWVRQFGTSESDAGGTAAPGPDGDFYITGTTEGSLGGPNNGSTDIFVMRCDAHGQPVWTSQVGSSEADWAYCACSDGDGGVFFGGATDGAVFGKYKGFPDAVAGHFDAGGTLTWGWQYGTAAVDATNGVALDAEGGLFAGGIKGGAGYADFFVARMTADCTPDCDSDNTLTLFDFLCFVNLFNALDPAADCDGSGTLDLFDFLCFTNAFNAGC